MPISLVRLGRLFICMLLIALLAGCSHQKGPEIVGTWDSTKGTEAVEFRKDGTGTFTYKDQTTPSQDFMWKSSGERDYLLEVSYVGTNKVISATLQSGVLNLQRETGTETYRKRSGP